MYVVLHPFYMLCWPCRFAFFGFFLLLLFLSDLCKGKHHAHTHTLLSVRAHPGKQGTRHSRQVGGLVDPASQGSEGSRMHNLVFEVEWEKTIRVFHCVVHVSEQQSIFSPVPQQLCGEHLRILAAAQWSDTLHENVAIYCVLLHAVHVISFPNWSAGRFLSPDSQKKLACLARTRKSHSNS